MQTTMESEDFELVLDAVDRRVNNQWAIDEEATTKFYLSRKQVEQLRTYLQDAPAGK